MVSLSLHDIVTTEVTTNSVNGTTWTTYKFINADGSYTEVTAFCKKEKDDDNN